MAKQEVSDYSQLSIEELEVLGADNDEEAMMELANRYDYGSEDCEQDFTEAKSGMNPQEKWEIPMHFVYWDIMPSTVLRRMWIWTRQQTISRRRSMPEVSGHM